MSVMRFQNLAVLFVCISGTKRIPTAAIYNRYKLRPRDIDRQSVATLPNVTMRAGGSAPENSQPVARLVRRTPAKQDT